MLNKINEINFEDLISYENLFPLFKTNNPYIDIEFQSRIEKYKTYIEFFANYSNFDITFLDNFLTESNGKINIFSELLTKNDFPEKNENDIYFTIIINVILMNILYLRINSYINNIYIQLKDFIHSTLKELQNNDIHYKLNEYLQLINESPEFFKRKDIMTSIRFSSKNDTASFRPREFMNIITQKKNTEIEIGENNSPKKSNNNIILIDNFLKNDDETPSFHKEYNSPEQKRKSFILESFSPKRKNISDIIPNIHNSSENIISFTRLINKNNKNDIKIYKDKNPLVSLLGICSEMFKKNIINFEEKCQFKKLIIDKEQYIFDIFEQCDEKNCLFEKIKNYLKKFF